MKSRTKARKRAILLPTDHTPMGDILRGSRAGSPPLSGSTGTLTIQCGACPGVLARGLHRHEVMNVVVECPRCRRLNPVRS